MHRYFMSRRAAIKYLMEIRRDTADPHLTVTIDTHLHEGMGGGAERALFDVRAGRVSYFVEAGLAAEARIVFIT